MRIGDMLVAAGLCTEAQVQEALASQKTSGNRLGEELVRLGHVAELQLTQVLSNQLAIPWVSLHRVEFSRELLILVPGKLADEHGCIPIYKRRVKKEETLFVAMEDPTSTESMAAISAAVGLPVRPMVAPPTDIRNAIRVYYFGQAPRPAAAPKRATRHPSSPEIEIDVDIPVDEPPPADLVEAAGAEPPSERPAPKKKKKRKRKTAKGPKLVTLTLLDGTTVRLPAPTSGKGAEVEGQEAAGSLTASDLVAALLARAQGADVDDVLPDAGWEALFGTLLQLLVRKGLIADWEFVEAWKANRAAE